VRRRKKQESYQQTYENSALGSSPGSLSRPFAPDQRLEPGMVQKRESVGSLADERDYSRKILRVFSPQSCECRMRLMIGDQSGWRLKVCGRRDMDGEGARGLFIGELIVYFVSRTVISFSLRFFLAAKGGMYICLESKQILFL